MTAKNVKGSGIRTIRQACLITVLLGLMLGLGGCGSTGANEQQATSTPAPPSSGTANVAVLVKDAPADNVFAFRITVAGASVTDSAGHTTTLTSGQQFEMRHLELAPTLGLYAAGLTAGTYNTLTLTFSSPQVVIVDATGAVIRPTTPVLGNATVPVPLNSFSLASGSNNGLMVDFDLGSSLSLDANGNYIINPVLRAATVSTSSAELDLVDSIGKIMSFPSSPPNSMVLQMTTTGNSVQVVADGNTILDSSIGQFSSLKIGQFIEVDAKLQGDGNFLAKSIELSAPDQTMRLQGVVTAVGADAQGNTALKLVSQK